jgi:hypothetical protein
MATQSITAASPLYPFLTAGGSLLIIGDAGSYKTAVLSSMSRAIASGRPWGSLATGKMTVRIDTWSSLERLDDAAFALTGEASEIEELRDTFASTPCDYGDSFPNKPNFEELRIVARQNNEGGPVVIAIDDFDRVAPIGYEANDRMLAQAMSHIVCNSRDDTSTVATMTASAETFMTDFRSLAKQFDSIAHVERLGDWWTLTLIKSANGPEAFQVEGEVFFPVVSEDALGNETRVAVAKPILQLIHNQRTF